MVAFCTADAELKTYLMAAIAHDNRSNRKGSMADVDSADI
jgi:hypothetical protein